MGRMGRMGVMGPHRPLSPNCPAPFSPSRPFSLSPSLRSSFLISLLPVFPGAVHFLPYAAILDKIPFLPFYQPADQYIALMNQRNGDIRDGLIRTFLNLFAVNGGVEMRLTKCPCLNTARVIIFPLLQSAYAQIVLVIKQ